MKKIIVNTILSIICYENTASMNHAASTTISRSNLSIQVVFPNIQQNTLINTSSLESDSQEPLHTSQSAENFSEDSPPARPAPMLSDESEGQILEPCSPPEDNFPITYPIEKTITELLQDVIQKFSTMETRLNDLSAQINVGSASVSETSSVTASQDFITTLHNLMESAQITLKNIQSSIQLEETLQTYRQEYLMQQKNAALVTLKQIQEASTIEELIHLDALNYILRLTLENMQNKLYMFHYIQIAAMNQNLSLKLDSENNSTLPIDYLNNLYLLLSHNFPNDSEIKVPPSWQKQYNIQGDDFGENIVTALTKHSFEVGELDSLLHNLSQIEELDSSSWQKSNSDKTLLSSLKTIIIKINQGNSELIPILHGLLIQLIAILHE